MTRCQRDNIGIINLLPPNLCNGVNLGGDEEPALELQEAGKGDPKPLRELAEKRLADMAFAQRRRRRKLELTGPKE